MMDNVLPFKRSVIAHKRVAEEIRLIREHLGLLRLSCGVDMIASVNAIEDELATLEASNNETLKVYQEEVSDGQVQADVIEYTSSFLYGFVYGKPAVTVTPHYMWRTSLDVYLQSTFIEGLERKFEITFSENLADAISLLDLMNLISREIKERYQNEPKLNKS